MRIGILTCGSEEENNRLAEAAKERGHEAKLLHLLKCSISVCREKPEIFYDGKSIGGEFDVIIPRIDTPQTQYGYTILRQFQSMHVFVSDKARSLELGRDKLRCAQRMLKYNVPFPTTGFAHSKEDFDNIINMAGGVPLIIKLVEGTEGVGVFLADDQKHAINLLKTFKQLDVPLIVQEFIEESAGTDIRAFVVGGKVVAAMQRVSSDDDFRANIALGGKSEVLELTEQEKEISLKAVKAIGINVAGVDLIRSEKGPLVIEINTSPNFGGKWGLEDVSGVDVAGEIIEYAVDAKKKNDEEKKSKRLLKNAA